MLGQVAVAAPLLWAAGSKLTAPGSRATLAVFGIDRPAMQRLAWTGVIVVEAAVAALVLLGLAGALLAAAGLFVAFAVVMWTAIRRGALGRACGCFGRRGQVSWQAVARSALLAAVTAGVYLLRMAPSERTVVALALAGLGLGVMVLAVAVLGLAREVGVLRLALASGGALEIAEEGPPVGERVEFRPWSNTDDAELVLAVFVSAGCPLCRSLEPSLEFLARDPWLTVVVLDEERDQAAWRAFATPGSPYSVALDPDGTVLAKGVCNSLPQLESVVATAARRREEMTAHA